MKAANRRLRRVRLRAWALGRDAVSADARIDHYATDHAERKRWRDARLAYQARRAA